MPCVDVFPSRTIVLVIQNGRNVGNTSLKCSFNDEYIICGLLHHIQSQINKTKDVYFNITFIKI